MRRHANYSAKSLAEALELINLATYIDEVCIQILLLGTFAL